MPRYIESTNAIRVLSLFYNYTEAERYDLALAISAVPTADVVARKRGKWIKESLVTDYLYKCSACKKYSRAMYDYCPNCGADMRGEQDG